MAAPAQLRDPKDYAQWTERYAVLPQSTWERFSGYGVLGLPFASGHVLAMRRFPASSVGPGYSSVWHRTPTGRWTFYADVRPSLSCSRYFSASVAESVTTEVDIAWTGPGRMEVAIPAVELEWTIDLESLWQTDVLNRIAALLPASLWRRPLVLSTVGLAARHLLGVGTVSLSGNTSNGYRFIANPRCIWMIRSSAATLRGEHLGKPEPLLEQASLRDFWIPQRGVFAFGDALFEAAPEPVMPKVA